MGKQIQIGDYIRGTTRNCPDHFGKVIGPGDDAGYFNVWVPYSLVFINLPDRMEFHEDECTKITPQEYFKHILSRD